MSQTPWSTHKGQGPKDISKLCQEMVGSHGYNPNTPWKNTYFQTIDPHFQLNTSQLNSFNRNKNVTINLYSICRTWVCFDWLSRWTITNIYYTKKTWSKNLWVSQKWCCSTTIIPTDFPRTYMPTYTATDSSGNFEEGTTTPSLKP